MKNPKYNSIRTFVLEAVLNSKSLRKKLSLSEHLKLYKWVSELNEVQIFKFLFEAKSDIPNYELQKALDMGLVAAALSPIPGGELVFLAARYIEENYNKRCLQRCKNKKDDKKICYWMCHYDSIVKVRKIIEQQYKKCKYEPIQKNKEKCNRKLGYLLSKWNVREIKIKNKFDMVQRMKVINRLRR